MKKLLLIFALPALAIAISAAYAALADKKPQRKIAVQTATCWSRTFEETIGIISQVEGVRYVESFSQILSKKFGEARLGPGMTDEQKAFVKNLLAEKNLKLVAYGVCGAANEKGIKNLFEFAKEFGVELLEVEPTVWQLPIYDKMAKEYGIKVAIHCHERNPRNNWWDPQTVLDAIKNFENIGFCAEIGAWSRSGIDPLKAMKIAEGRIAGTHFKDQKTFNDLKSAAVIYGTGCLDMKAILAEFDRQKYDGYFVIEHGNDQDKSLEVIKANVEFLKKN